MKIGNIIFEATKDLDQEIGNLKWMTVRRIILKHIEEARKELIRTAAIEKELLRTAAKERELFNQAIGIES